MDEIEVSDQNQMMKKTETKESAKRRERFTTEKVRTSMTVTLSRESRDIIA